MNKFIYRTAATFEEFTNFQLKAYYVSNVDKNLNEVLNAVSPELATSFLFSFPEWLTPACSLGAAVYVVGKMLKSIWNYCNRPKK